MINLDNFILLSSESILDQEDPTQEWLEEHDQEMADIVFDEAGIDVIDDFVTLIFASDWRNNINIEHGIVDDETARLNAKEGVDLFMNKITGNCVFIAYYGDKLDALEIVNDNVSVDDIIRSYR